MKEQTNELENNLKNNESVEKRDKKEKPLFTYCHDRIIKHNDTVMVKTLKFTFTKKIKSHKMITINKIKVPMKLIVGQEYDSWFIMDRKKKTIEKIDYYPHSHDYEYMDEKEEEKKDNRNLSLKHDNKQSLDCNDISLMRESGSTEDMISALKVNSNTFENKTSFSQSKYIKRKKRKYDDYFTIIRPTTQELLHYFVKHQLSRVEFFREDTLARMLHLAQITVQSNVCCFDSCESILTSAVFERYQGKLPVLVRLAPQDTIGQNRQFLNDQGIQLNQSTIEELTLLKFKEKVEADPTTYAFDSVLFSSSKIQMWPLVELVWPCMVNCAMMVIHSKYRGPLEEIHEKLLEHRVAVNVELSESWYRPTQVLPGRTHPEMTYRGSSGWLLVVTKVRNF